MQKIVAIFKLISMLNLTMWQGLHHIFFEDMKVETVLFETKKFKHNKKQKAVSYLEKLYRK